MISVFAYEASKIGVSRYVLQIAKNKDEELIDFLYAFMSLRNFSLLLVLVLVGIPAITIGFCLLIIPGAYLTLLFSLVEFVAADQPKMTFCELWEESFTLLSGNFWGYLCMKIQLWLLSGFLSIVTIGIGTLWILPYTWNV